MIIVSNTSPINYLVLIEQIDILPQLFQEVVIPHSVFAELNDPATPRLVQDWIAQPPAWLKKQADVSQAEDSLNHLDPGERAAIALAEQLQADLILLDDMAARKAALDRGLTLTGVLGILDQAASLGLIDLPISIERLQQTTFRVAPNLLRRLLDKHS